MSFVFISHATQDKLRVKPLTDALLSAGIDVFLDAPDAAGYNAAEVVRFRRLHGGRETYPVQLRTAVKEAGCVLVCWSEQATSAGVIDGTERHTWMAEIARAEEKAVHCILDETPISRLPTQYKLDQFVRIRVAAENHEATLAKLIADVRLKITETTNDALQAQRRLVSLKTGSGYRADIALPLLADRSRQEDEFYRAVSTAAGEGGVYPVVLKGPSNELPEAFLDRMEKASGRLHRDGAVWFQRRIDWPKEARDSKDFAAAYRTQLWRKLELVGRPDDQRIAEHLEQRDLTAVLHRIEAKHWRRREEPELIRAWLEYWSMLSKQGRRIKVVPVLLVPLPKAKPGWRDCPNMGSGGRVGVRDIWKSMRRFANGQAPTPEGIQLTLPPVLGPISDVDSIAWRDEHLAHFDAAKSAAIDNQIRDVFARGAARKHGISHEEFNQRFAPLCAGST